MTKRKDEHYQIAYKFDGRPFTRSEFMKLYREEYPDRKLGAMIPSDYCFNPMGGRPAKGTENYPKFLGWLGRGRYKLIGRSKPA
jgi:hypothetical protein